MTHPLSSLYLNGLRMGRVDRRSGCGIISKSLLHSAGPIAGPMGGSVATSSPELEIGYALFVGTAVMGSSGGLGLYTCPLLKELGSAQMLFLFVLIGCKWRLFFLFLFFSFFFLYLFSFFLETQAVTCDVRNFRSLWNN